MDIHFMVSIKPRRARRMEPPTSLRKRHEFNEECDGATGQRATKGRANGHYIKANMGTVVT